jgi:hypothetical protein
MDVLWPRASAPEGGSIAVGGRNAVQIAEADVHAAVWKLPDVYCR